jgi:hypothetical protein
LVDCIKVVTTLITLGLHTKRVFYMRENVLILWYSEHIYVFLDSNYYHITIITTITSSYSEAFKLLITLSDYNNIHNSPIANLIREAVLRTKGMLQRF